MRQFFSGVLISELKPQMQNYSTKERDNVDYHWLATWLILLYN